MQNIAKSLSLLTKVFLGSAIKRENDSVVNGKNELFKRLLGEEGNALYSPATIHQVLCILGYITTGEAKKEILQVLGIKENELEDYAKALLIAFNKETKKTSNFENTKGEESSTAEKVCTLESSIWFGGASDLNEEKLNELYHKLGTEYFVGDELSDSFNQKLRDWLNIRTNNMLASYVKNMKLPLNLVFALYSALYLKAKWNNVEFKKENTKKEKFYTINGNYEIIDFMHTKYEACVTEGSNFTCVGLPLQGDFVINFLLPKEEVNPRELFDDEEANKCLEQYNSKDGISCNIALSIPHIDIIANLDLLETLRKMGFKQLLTSIETTVSIGSQPLSSGKQLNRMIVKEEGVEVASICYAQMLNSCIGRDFEFKLNRPFLVSIIEKDSKIPLMVGVIENPVVKK